MKTISEVIHEVYMEEYRSTLPGHSYPENPTT